MSLGNCKVKQQNDAPTRTAKTRAPTTDAGEDVEQWGLPLAAGGLLNGIATWEGNCSFIKYWTYSYHTIQQSITLLGIDPTIAALVIIAKTWRQPGCPSASEQTVVHPDNGVLALKTDALPAVKRLEETEKHILSASGQRERAQTA